MTNFNGYMKALAAQAESTIDVCLSQARATGDDGAEALDGLIDYGKELVARAELKKAEIERKGRADDTLN